MDSAASFKRKLDEVMSEDIVQELRSHVMQKLQGTGLEAHKDTVVAILQVADVKLSWLEVPNNKQDLVTILEGPWLYYDTNGELQRKLSKLTIEGVESVHDAAIVIAGTLVRDAPPPAVPEDIVQGLQSHVKQKLQGTHLEAHKDTVVAILQVAQVTVSWLEVPNNEQDLVTILKGPRLYYDTGGELQEEFSALGIDTIRRVHNAAVVIAGTLISRPPPAVPGGSGATPRTYCGYTEALERARRFVAAIMRVDAIEDIPNGGGMQVMRDVPCLETEFTIRTLVIRPLTVPFWQACINCTHRIDPESQEDKRSRVCAVGSSGIGKSTSTPLLIRMLLERGETVVYLVRSTTQISWYYEFIPGSDPKVYPETWRSTAIDSLRQRSTNFIVDPGDTKDSCLQGTMFNPRFIIVASPDDRHWGENEFDKSRGGIGGLFMHYPLWELEELLLARSLLRPDMSGGEVAARYQEMGGIPSIIFGSQHYVDCFLKRQKNKIINLTESQAARIASGREWSVSSYSPWLPSTDIMGYAVDGKEPDFAQAKVQILSPLAQERVQRRLRNEI
jgi:hypothetical protein